MTNSRVFKVFIASPGGLEPERRVFRETLEQFNSENAGRGLEFQAVGWDLIDAGTGGAQERIDRKIEACDFFILVLWNWWGTARKGRGGRRSDCSNSEWEFRLALKCYASDHYPMKEVVVFFKTVSNEQERDAGPQLKKVKRFARELKASNKHLFKTFLDVPDFQSYLRFLLAQWAIKSGEGDYNPAHLDILMRGVRDWNRWRSRQAQVKPNLFGVNLSGADFSSDTEGIDLRDANLAQSNLSGSNLANANLVGANLSDARLHGTNLAGANLEGTNLKGAVIINARMDGADMSDAVLGGTLIGRTDLSLVRGLNSVRHEERSEIGLGTVSSSQRELPTLFFESAGVPAQLVRCLRAKARSTP